MDSQRHNIYKNIMSGSPRIDEKYLEKILHLKNNEMINEVEISKAIDSNTALIIRTSIHIANEDNIYMRKLFIKAAKPDNVYHDKSMREVSFYKILLRHPNAKVPVPKCYDAYISDEDGEFFIVLEDLSERYKTVSINDLLSEDIWYSCAESLAKFHAAFWNDSQLIIDEMTVKSEQEIESEVRRNQEYLNSFLAEFQGKFDERTVHIFKQALNINSKMMREGNQAPSKRNHITICNGDSHIYNFLVPYDKSHEPVMIDFQFWGDGSGIGDLAHLTRVDFSHELKKTIQIPLVKRYHETLQKCGVKDYFWEECISDYRKEVASMVLIPIWQFCCFGLKYEEWIEDVEGLVFNYECMGCEEIYTAK